MASDSLSERPEPFNQMSPARAAFQLSERVANLELASLLLAKAEGLTAVALDTALSNITRSQRHHYLAALDELIIAAHEQIDDVLIKLRPERN